MERERQLLLEWIVWRIKAYSSSYFETTRLLLEGFGGEGALMEFDGITLFPLGEAEMRAKLSQARRGKVVSLFIATLEDNSSFWLRLTGPRGSGVKVGYSYSLAEDGTLTVKEEFTAIMA